MCARLQLQRNFDYFVIISLFFFCHIWFCRTLSHRSRFGIPQRTKISSLTSSPDSSPSPIAIALGQVSVTSGSSTTTTLSAGGNTAGSINSDNSATMTGGQAGTNTNSAISATNSSSTNGSTATTNPATDSKLWFANSTTASPHSLSPKAFSFDTGTNPTSTADISTAEPLRYLFNAFPLYSMYMCILVFVFLSSICLLYLLFSHFVYPFRIRTDHSVFHIYIQFR